MKTKAIFALEHYDPVHGRDVINEVFGRGRKEHIASLVDLYPEVITRDNIAQHADDLREVEVIFSTWSMMEMSPADFTAMPNLKVVLYAAGTVRGFGAALLERGIKLCSAWKANAVPVAEYCLGHVLIALKGALQNHNDLCVRGKTWHNDAFLGPGIYESRIALIGMGSVALKLQELLLPFYVEVVLVDPRPEQGTISLEEAFATSQVVSNHLPDRPELVGLLNGALFASMPPNSTFINTGRGAQVNETELIDVLDQRPDMMAVLDVTSPEPPPADSPLRSLNNIFLTSHIAGSQNRELQRMADFMIEDYQRWADGKPLLNEVSHTIFHDMA